jgi:hypothetical protein
VRSPVARDFGVAQVLVFGDSACGSLPPEFEGAGFELAAHQADDGGLIKPKLNGDGFKAGAVFPSHFNDARNVGGR